MLLEELEVAQPIARDLEEDLDKFLLILDATSHHIGKIIMQ